MTHHPDDFTPALPEGGYHEPLDAEYGLDGDLGSERMVTPWTRTPDEVKNFIYDSAEREAELRSRGYSAERIRSDWNKTFRHGALALALRYGDYAGDIFLRPDDEQRRARPNPSTLPEWARDFQRRANADNDSDTPVPDWRERQFKDD